MDHKTTKTGKGGHINWKTSTSIEFNWRRIFKVPLFPRSQCFILSQDRRGWRNHETGKIGPPRIRFLAFESLHDTLEKCKTTLQLDIQQLDREHIAAIRYGKIP